MKGPQSEAVVSIESEFNHLNALKDLWINEHVECGELTHKTDDVGDEEGVRIFIRDITVRCIKISYC